MKEKIIDYIEQLEAKAYQSDTYFKERNELYISNQEKDKEITRLNNIITELEKDLKNKIEEDRLNILSNPHWLYVLDKLKELKEGNK